MYFPAYAQTNLLKQFPVQSAPTLPTFSYPEFRTKRTSDFPFFYFRSSMTRCYLTIGTKMQANLIILQ